MRMGVVELLVVLAVVILLFVPKQLPKVTAAVKESISAFKKGRLEAENEEVHE